MKGKSSKTSDIIPQEIIENKILFIRGKKVMLDRTLADLYGVETKALNQAVKRNVNRFPEDFMFQLTKDEANKLLRSQFVTLKRGRFLCGKSKWVISNIKSGFNDFIVNVAGHSDPRTTKRYTHFSVEETKMPLQALIDRRGNYG